MKKGNDNLLFFMITLLLVVNVLFTTLLGINLLKDNNVINNNDDKLRNNCLIVNNESINIKVNDSTFKDDDEVIYENIDYIDIRDGIVNYSLIYNIEENTFKQNNTSTLNSPLLVRFSYSYDNINYTTLNNVVSIGYSNISPLIGSLYDISGITGKIKVLLNREISKKDTDKLYFKSETIVKKKNSNVDNNVKASFKIETN